MATVQELAREAYDGLEVATRDDGSRYTRRKDDAPALHLVAVPRCGARSVLRGPSKLSGVTGATRKGRC